MARPHAALPDFVIGGAPKCGTTTVFEYIGQHPDVFVADPKEPHFFLTAMTGRPMMGMRYSRAGYEALFAGRRADQRAGEGSTHYLHNADVVAPHLAEVVPDVRLVFCLREPAERAFSHYCYRYATAGPYTAGGVGWRGSFEDFAATPELDRMGDYASALSVYYDHFDREQVLVLLVDDLKRDASAVMRRLCEHVGVDSAFEFDVSERSNETEYPRFPALMPLADRGTASAYVRASRPMKLRLLRTRHRVLFSSRAPKTSPDPTEIRSLRERYRPDVERLETLIRRDLSAWKR